MKRILIGLITLLILFPNIASATDWYVRPAGGSYGNEDGTSYNNAWDGLLNVVWGTGGVQPGDNLYVCGLHVHDMTDSGYVATQAQINTISGTGENSRVTIRGDCPGDSGIVWNAYKFSYEPWVDEGGGVWSITLPGCGFTDNYFEDITADSWTLLEPVGSLQECISTPGSFYLNGSCRGDTIYVHTSDGGDPTNKVYGNRFGYSFVVRGREYLTFLNLTFYDAGFSLSESNPSTHLRWENCKLSIGESRMFSWFDNCHYNEIINCDISGAGNGIYLISGTNNAPSNYLIKGNTIHDIGIRPSLQNGDAHCIGIQGGNNGVIEDNECYNAGSGVTLYAFTNQEMKNNTVSRNIVNDTNTFGGANSRGIETSCDNPSLSDKSGNKFYNNIVYNANICYRFQWEDEQEIYNNVAYNCNWGLVSSRSYTDPNTGLVYGPNVKARNNIFLNSGTQHISYSSSGTVASANYDYNIFYPDGPTMFRHNSGGEMSFGEWQTHSVSFCSGCVYDPNSMVADPLFEDQSNNNFHLQSNSPARDTGVDVGLTTDFDGNTIPTGSAPDIGAFEYQGTGDVWYVRPAGGNYGNEDGSSYADAWDGLGNVVWGTGGIEAGDTLYVCGMHLRTRTGGSAWEVFTPGVSGTGENARIIIRGDCPGDHGIIWGAGIMAHEPWVNEGGGVWSITAVGTPNNMWYFEDINEDSWTVLKQTQSLNDCRATPGSFYSPDYAAGSKLYIHTSDNQDPTNRIAANRLGYHLIMNDRHYITWLNLRFYSIYRWVEISGPPYRFVTYMKWENCTIWYGEHSHFLFRNNNAYNEFINCDIAYARNGIGFAETPIGSGSTGDGSEPHDFVVRGCTFHHIGIPYGDSDSHAVSGQGSRNILIENNEMYLVGSGITFYCYNENQAIRNITVRYNWIHDTHSLWGANSRGIEMNTGPGQAPGTSADIYGNIVGPNVSSVCYRYFWTELGKFYNNVAYDCGTSFYIHHSLSPVNARIRNCISVNPQTYHIRFSSNNDSSVTSLDSDYNIFYPVDQDNFFIYVPEARITDLNFSEWQALSISGSNFDTHSLAVNPMFLNPLNNNFHLHKDSPAIDSGTNVGLTKDYDGNPIPQGAGYDIGAFEYLSGFTLPGDLNRDGSVDIADLAIIAIHFGKRNIHPLWNATADVMANDEIDIYDIVFVASRFT